MWERAWCEGFLDGALDFALGSFLDICAPSEGGVAARPFGGGEAFAARPRPPECGGVTARPDTDDDLGDFAVRLHDTDECAGDGSGLLSRVGVRGGLLRAGIGIREGKSRSWLEGVSLTVV